MKDSMQSLLMAILLCVATLVNAVEKIDGVAAIVNKEVITYSAWMAQFRQVKRDLSQMQSDLPSDEVLKSQVLQHMIDVELQVQQAKDYGVTVSDKALQTTIEQIAKQNKLTLSQLKQKLLADGLSYSQYQKNIRQQMLMAEIQKKLIARNIKITPDQVEREYQEALHKQDAANDYHVKTIFVPLSDLPSNREKIKAKQSIEMIYDKLKKGASFNANALSKISDTVQDNDLDWRHLTDLPQIFMSSVKQLSVGAFSKPILTPNGFHIVKLLDKRSAFKPHYVTLSHIRHILLRAPEKNSAASVKRRINVLYESLQQGRDFEKLAREFSEDTHSATNGGDIGWMRDRDLVPSFAKGASKLAIRQISRPVQTEFGWHIIQVLGRKQKDDSLDMFKESIAEKLYHKAFDQGVKEWVEGLRKKSYIILSDKA